MKLTNAYGVPDWLGQVIGHIQAQYNPGNSDYTATSLLEPPMITGLKYQYADQLEQDISDTLAAFLGTAVHDSIEAALKDDPRYLIEQRFYRKIEVPDSPAKKVFVVSGQIDLYDLETQHLSDHKITGGYKIQFGDHFDYEAQASVNRWLMQANGYDPQSFAINAIIKDWRRSESKQKANYPDIPFVELPLPFWSINDTEEFIKEKILEKEYAKQGVMRPCSKYERWQKDSKFAVVKKGRKSSVRNFDRQEDAEKYIENNNLEGHWVEERKAEATRCESFCPVSQFCNQSGPL